MSPATPTPPPSTEQVTAALARVNDPEIRRPITSSHSPEPGSTRLTTAVQLTGPPPAPRGTMTVTRPEPASPGSGCSPGPVTT